MDGLIAVIAIACTRRVAIVILIKALVNTVHAVIIDPIADFLCVRIYMISTARASSRCIITIVASAACTANAITVLVATPVIQHKSLRGKLTARFLGRRTSGIDLNKAVNAFARRKSRRGLKTVHWAVNSTGDRFISSAKTVVW
jgi:hypothetical protein